MVSWAVSFKKSNVEDLQMQLSRLLEDPERVHMYKESARQYICEKYSWDEATENTVVVYEECRK